MRRPTLAKERQGPLQGEALQKTINLLRAGRMTAQQLGDALATDANVAPNHVTRKGYDLIRQQLRRMAKDGDIRRVGRGIYTALPD